MIDNNSQEVLDRFFTALQTLIDNGIFRGYSAFADRYGINRGNFTSLRTNRTRVAFQAGWLSNLVNDYHISAYWLLSGKGSIWQDGFTPEIVKILLKNNQSSTDVPQSRNGDIAN